MGSKEKTNTSFRVIKYPDGIDTYAGGTEVESEGSTYMCKSGVLSRLCSKESFSPTSSSGSKVWSKLN